MLDLILAALVGLGVWRGLRTGVLSQLAGTVGLVLAFWLALALMEPVGALVVMSLGLSERIAPILGFVTMFTTVLAGSVLVTRLVQRALEGLRLSFVNKLAGGAFGGLRAALGLSVLLLVTGAAVMPGGGSLLVGTEMRENSALYEPMRALAPAAWALYQQIAPGVQAQLQEKFAPDDS